MSRAKRVQRAPDPTELQEVLIQLARMEERLAGLTDKLSNWQEQMELKYTQLEARFQKELDEVRSEVKAIKKTAWNVLWAALTTIATALFTRFSGLIFK